jgi:hypothetical protein
MAIVDESPAEEEAPLQPEASQPVGQHIYICDRCGFEMVEKNCKVLCLNCGSQYDCSDLSIYFD